MNSKELPARPSLEQYKKQAKDLLKNFKSGDRDALQLALQRIKKDHPSFGRLAELELKGAKLAVADAQLVIAREHGFESWPRFAKHIEGLTRQNSPVSKFALPADPRRRGLLIEKIRADARMAAALRGKIPVQ